MSPRILLLFLALPLFLVLSSPQAEGGQPQSLPVSPLIVETDKGRFEFQVELARTLEEKRIGLMYREEMAEDHGMLFYYPFPRPASFWMKNTYIPLDMIYIRYDGSVANIHKDVQPLDLNPKVSQGRVMGVLELNAGLADKMGLKPGDRVYHRIFGNYPESSPADE